MADIPARTIASFQDGKRELLAAESAGQYEQFGKGGATVRVAYPAGALIVADRDRIIAGPLAPIDATELAGQILAGDARAMTAPDSLLSLAAAVFGFGLFPPQDGEPIEAECAATAESAQEMRS